MTVILKAMFGGRNWLLTLLVCVAVGGCFRGGFWQMGRGEKKGPLNKILGPHWGGPPFDLTRGALPADLEELEYRRIEVNGQFDYAHQVVLKNDTRDGVPGVNLVTPLVMPDGRAILVARGWVPLGNAAPEKWPQFEEKGAQPVVGLIKESQTLPGATMPTSPQTEWFRIDVEAIQRQVPYPLLPAFLAMLPEPGRSVEALPARTPPPELADEYMHVSYTIQWFTFAVIFAFGYVQYIILQERRRRRAQEGAATAAQQATTDLPTLPHQV